MSPITITSTSTERAGDRPTALLQTRRHWPGSAALLAALLLAASAGGSLGGEARWALSASGRVEPVGEERRLQFPVPGNIARMDCEEGQAVKAGQVLAELDGAEERAALAAAEAGLARAEAALRRLEAGARAEDRAAADAEAEVAARELDRVAAGARREERDLAEARLALCRTETAAAERAAERVRQLRSGEIKAASQEEQDTADDRLAAARAAEAQAAAHRALVVAPAREEDLAVARAGRKAAEARAATVKAPAREEDLAAARAEVGAARAGLAAAKARLEKLQLRAPVDGKVLKIYRRVGEPALPGGELPVLAVGDTSRLLARAEVDESDIVKLRLGQAVHAKVAALGGRELTGRVKAISPSMGRKRLFSDSPREKVDTKVLEVLVELDGQPGLPVGFRLDLYFAEGR